MNYDGIKRNTDKKYSKLTINRTYMELYQNKDSVSTSVYLLKNYFTKKVLQDPYFIAEFLAKPQSYIPVIVASIQSMFTEMLDKPIEELDLRVDITKMSSDLTSPYLEMNKKGSIDIDDSYKFIIIVTFKYDERGIQRVIIHSQNLYTQILARGTYGLKLSKFNSRKKDIEINNLYKTGNCTIEKASFEEDVSYNTSTISLDYLMFMKNLEQFYTGTLLDKGDIMFELVNEYRRKGRPRTLNSSSIIDTRTDENGEMKIDYLNNLLYRFVLFCKNSYNGAYGEEEGKRFATKLTTKKNRPKIVEKMMEDSLFKIDGGFDVVEYDEDINKENIKQAEYEFKLLIDLGILPRVDSTNRDKSTLRVRKLGREKATGMFIGNFKMLIVDKTFSFIHEYGHMLDFKTFMLDGVLDSYKEDFENIRNIYSSNMLKTYDKLVEELENTETDNEILIRKVNVLGKHLGYYMDSSEIYARAYEHYMKSKGLKSILLGTIDQNLHERWVNGAIGRLAYESFDLPELNDLVISYFDKYYPVDVDSIDSFLSLSSEKPELESDYIEYDVIRQKQLNEANVSPEQQKINELAFREYLSYATIDDVKNILLEMDSDYDELDDYFEYANYYGIYLNADYTLATEYILNKDRKLQGIKKIFLEDGVIGQMNIDYLSKKVYRYINN